MHLRTVIGIGTLALTLVGGAAALVGPADAAGPTCDGKAATIVGDRNGLPDNQTLQIDGTDGPDVIVGSEGLDQIFAFGGDDTICGLGGADLIQGVGGEDRIFGGSGNDFLTGGDDDDLVVGGRGNDRLRGDLGTDVCKGGKGRDEVFSFSSCETLKGVELGA